ncbi:chemotaxis protein CheX [Desulfohalotomaculum tongense]|uniref:chemotaxis protein CheX n=1 Tax=Desulforadius tongensis TaxID=1216062 RepID=UPI00195AFF5B|nr:chemotaxis protein CheX [Desulforadius tongensis]MBM7856024.1 chemotaxis protein CheX [Desulforadius tongensis]
MDVNYINSFVLGAEDIFSQVAAGIDLSRQKPYAKKTPFYANSVVSIVGFNGDIKGQVVFVFTREFALELSSAMCGMEMQEIDELALSALGEISNMISGRAVIKLDELVQEKANITPPTVLHAEDKINISVEPPIICIPYSSNGKACFEINFALNSKKGDA